MSPQQPKSLFLRLINGLAYRGKQQQVLHNTNSGITHRDNLATKCPDFALQNIWICQNIGSFSGIGFRETSPVIDFISMNRLQKMLRPYFILLCFAHCNPYPDGEGFAGLHHIAAPLIVMLCAILQPERKCPGFAKY